MLKQKFTELFKNNGYYVLAALCIVALAAAIGIISASTSDEMTSETAADFANAQTEALTDNDDDAQEEIAANSGLDYVEGYDADQIQDIITQLEENTQENDAAANNTDDRLSADQSTGDDTSAAAATAAAAQTSFFDESQTLSWPLTGDILLDYSMSTTTYFKTLDQYKCNPGLLITADVNTEVHCAFGGTVESITNDAEYGQMVTIDMGNDFKAVYGQLKDICVLEGDTVPKGSIIGTVAEPTKYYTEEGSHLYFELSKDDIPADPKVFFE